MSRDVADVIRFVAREIRLVRAWLVLHVPRVCIVRPRPSLTCPRLMRTCSSLLALVISMGPLLVRIVALCTHEDGVTFVLLVCCLILCSRVLAT